MEGCAEREAAAPGRTMILNPVYLPPETCRLNPPFYSGSTSPWTSRGPWPTRCSSGPLGAAPAHSVQLRTTWVASAARGFMPVRRAVRRASARALGGQRPESSAGCGAAAAVIEMPLDAVNGKRRALGGTGRVAASAATGFGDEIAHLQPGLWRSQGRPRGGAGGRKRRRREEPRKSSCTSSENQDATCALRR